MKETVREKEFMWGDQGSRVMDTNKVCHVKNVTIKPDILCKYYIPITRIVISSWGYIIRTLPEHKHLSKALSPNSSK